MLPSSSAGKAGTEYSLSQPLVVQDFRVREKVLNVLKVILFKIGEIMFHVFRYYANNFTSEIPQLRYQEITGGKNKIIRSEEQNLNDPFMNYSFLHNSKRALQFSFLLRDPLKSINENLPSEHRNT